jgi:hypothetical protein
MLFIAVSAVPIAIWASYRRNRYVSVEEICASLATEDIQFVNRNLRYGKFVRSDDELEFHYATPNGDSRIVHWGKASTRFEEVRNAQLKHQLGTAQLTDATHVQQLSIGASHDYPKIYDVVFQTNGRDGSVAILDGGSNVFPYTNTTN